MARVLRVLAVVAVLAVLVATQGPSEATLGGGPRPTGAGDTSAQPGKLRAQITFTKSTAHPWHSTITWDAARQRADGSWKVLAHDSWRAGSGLPGGSAENACVKGHGWLPNGTYSLLQYDDYPGNLIHGRAFRLNDKRCANGTLREQLFIHTEAGRGQHPVRRRPRRPAVPVGVPQDQRLHLARLHQDVAVARSWP